MRGASLAGVCCLVAASLVALDAAMAQNVTASVNDLFRYGVGREVQVAGQPSVNKNYLEEVANGQVFIGDLILGFRYQLDNPTELYHQSFDGFKKRYIEYRKDGLSVRAGTMNAMIGRGLSLNLFDNRGIYYDTELDGLRLAYRATAGGVGIDGQAMAGVIAFRDFVGTGASASTAANDTGRLENYNLQAGEIGFTPHIDAIKDVIKQIRLGLSWVHATGEWPPPSPLPPLKDSLEVTLPGLSLDVKARDVQWYIEYAGKRTTTPVRTSHGTGGELFTGGMYTSISVNRPGFGASLEYKDYHFDDIPADQVSSERFRTTKALPFQNAPIVYKEHSFTLCTRVSHAVNFNDEVGMQLDGYYAASENLMFNFNGSASSTHKGTVLDNATGTYKVLTRSTLWLPSMDDAYLPFWELYVESEYTFSDESYIKVAANRNQTPDPQYGRTTAFPLVKGNFYLSPEWSLNFDFENMWAFDPHKTADTTGMARLLSTNPHRTFSQVLSLGFSRTPYGGLTAIYEWSTETSDVSGRRNWFLLEGSVRVGESNTIIVSWGSERGGIRCSNGICRTLNSFEGWRLTFASRF